MNAGDVIIHHKCRKQNGDIQPKYLVHLNNPSDDNFHIFCFATSERKRNCDASKRCNSDDGHFYIGKIEDIFVKDTYLVFHYFICNSDETVNSMIKDSTCEFLGNLGKNLTNQIRNCIKRYDLSQYERDLIFN